jgi:hypothetical protein
MPRLLLLSLLVIGLMNTHTARAHATIVMGDVVTTPTTPRPGEPFTLRLSLEDPLGTPIEDAVVAVEFRSLPDVRAAEPAGEDVRNEADTLIISPETEAAVPPVRSEFREVEAGVYETQSQIPEGGIYHMLFRDTTYRQEEARAALIYVVSDSDMSQDDAADANDAVLSFLFPPTAVGPQFLWLWLFLLIGLPLFAAGVVTVMVLRHAKKNEQPAAPA